jgi:hypothetical protein
VFARCNFTANRASEGGGVYCRADSGGILPRFVNCQFRGNAAQLDVNGFGGDGGALYAGANSGVTLVNCLALANESDRDGAAFHLRSNVEVANEITNCTFVNNSADYDASGNGVGGGVCFTDSDEPDVEASEITNCIFWGNTDAVGGTVADAQIHVVASDPLHLTLSYSDVEGGLPTDVIPGDGNIADNPRFADESEGNYRLKACSPCKDNADEGELPRDFADLNLDFNRFDPTPLDLDMGERTLDSPGDPSEFALDMGAYEFVPPFCPMDCADGGNGVVDIVDFLAILAEWGSECTPCDQAGGPGVGVQEFLQFLAAFGPCPEGGGEIPKTIQDCIDRFGIEDPRILERCICTVAPEECEPQE